MITMPLLFLAGSPGPLELLVIFAVVLILFGPRKLPEIGRSIGRMLHELRKASEDFKSQIMSIDETAEPPMAETGLTNANDTPPGEFPPPDDADPAARQNTDPMTDAPENISCDEESASGAAEEGDSCDDREKGI